jgi:hypothetical protein
MLNLDLSINLCKINLGEKIDQSLIQEASLKKLGFLMGLFIKKPRSNIVYWAKNCYIGCLKNRITLIPRIKSSDGPFMFGTSVFLYTIRDNIYKIVYQILDNKDIARSEFNFFKETCSDNFGNPSRADDKLCAWEDDQSAIFAQIGHNDKNLFVYWELANPK